MESRDESENERESKTEREKERESERERERGREREIIGLTFYKLTGSPCITPILCPALDLIEANRGHD